MRIFSSYNWQKIKNIEPVPENNNILTCFKKAVRFKSGVHVRLTFQKVILFAFDTVFNVCFVLQCNKNLEN